MLLPRLNFENLRFGVLGPEGGSSSVADILTLGLNRPLPYPLGFSSKVSESLTAVGVGRTCCDIKIKNNIKNKNNTRVKPSSVCK